MNLFIALLQGCVFLVLELFLDGTEVHWMFDQRGIVHETCDNVRAHICIRNPAVDATTRHNKRNVSPGSRRRATYQATPIERAPERVLEFQHELHTTITTIR
jgi:hypothetical protein